MLSIAAFALLAVGLVLLLVITRRSRRFLPVIALFIGSAALFAVRLRALDRETKRLDAWIDEGCRAVASDLESDVRRYRLAVAEHGADFDRQAHEVQRSYLKAGDPRRRWVRMCVSTQDADDCLATDLNEHTLDKIERAAAAIRGRKSCHTREIN